jgi:hypothetical protein
MNLIKKSIIMKSQDRFSIRYFLLAGLCFFNLGYAEIKNCGGVITNQDCEGGQKLADEQPFRTPPPDAQELKQKAELLAGLRSASSKAKEKHGVEIDTRVTETVCKISSVAECGEVVLAKERELNALIESARIAQERRAEREALLRETQLSPSDSAANQNNHQVITVIQNRMTSNTVVDARGNAPALPQATPITGFVPGQPTVVSVAPIITDCSKTPGGCAVTGAALGR